MPRGMAPCSGTISGRHCREAPINIPCSNNAIRQQLSLKITLYGSYSTGKVSLDRLFFQIRTLSKSTFFKEVCVRPYLSNLIAEADAYQWELLFKSTIWMGRVCSMRCKILLRTRDPVMQLTLEQSRKLKNTKVLLLAGMVLGPLYTVFSDGFSSFYPFINTLIIGLITALFVAFFEFILFTGQVRKLKFYKLFFLRIFLYTFSISATIALVMIISRMFRNDMNFRSVYRSEEFQHYLWKEDFLFGVLYALGLITVVIFIMQIKRKIGPKILFGFISGRYYHPRVVERIVMFIEIQKVKTIIEKIGRVSFFRYLNDFIFDITETVLFHKGEFYEYVENEILLVWNVKNGTEKANCIRTFFEIQEVIEAKKMTYFEKYGFIPEFHAALHFGSVIRGEIGDVKSEIKYQGDVMNTAARMLGETSRENNFLISADLMEQLTLPILYRKEELGKYDLRGKHQGIALYALKESQTMSL